MNAMWCVIKKRGSRARSYLWWLQWFVYQQNKKAGSRGVGSLKKEKTSHKTGNCNLRCSPSVVVVSDGNATQRNDDSTWHDHSWLGTAQALLILRVNILCFTIKKKRRWWESCTQSRDDCKSQRPGQWSELLEFVDSIHFLLCRLRSSSQ